MEDIYLVNKQPQKRGNGYIYVVRVGTHYKIGKSINPKDRCSEYTKLFEKPETIFCKYVKDYSKLETDIHKLFTDKRVRGEWFDLDSEDLNELEKVLVSNEIKGKPVKIEKQEDMYKDLVLVTVDKTPLFYADDYEIVQKLSDNSAIYLSLIKMLHTALGKYNLLMKNGKKYGATKISKDLGITRQSASAHIRKLKELNVLRDAKTNKGTFLAVNPKYYVRKECCTDIADEVFKD